MKIEYFDPQPLLKQDEDFMLMLEADKDFEEFVAIVRKRANLPPEGVSLTKTDDNHIVFPKGSTEILNQINKDNLYHGVKWILYAYRLPLTWFTTIYSIVVFSIFMRPHRDYHKKTEIIYRTKLDLLPRLPDYGREANPTDSEPHMLIIIKEGMSFRELTQELEKRREAIERYLSYLPHDPKTKVKDIKVRNRMLELNRTGEYSYSDIGKIINDEFGEDYAFLTDQATINTYITRHKEAIKNLKSESKMSPQFYERLLIALSEPVSTEIDAQSLNARNTVLKARLDSKV